jgi:hypothetical protein
MSGYRVLKQPYMVNSGLTTLWPEASRIVWLPTNEGGETAL